jgi:hypothetical protein
VQYYLQSIQQRAEEFMVGEQDWKQLASSSGNFLSKTEHRAPLACCNDVNAIMVGGGEGSGSGCCGGGDQQRSPLTGDGGAG